MTLLIYSSLLLAVIVLGLPYWLARILTGERYRTGLRQRLGYLPPSIRDIIAVAHRERRDVIWLHAVSVGEVLAATRLIADLQAARPGLEVALSTTTETGHRLARERFPTAAVFFFPLDFAFLMRRHLALLQPRMVILMESELWPNLIHECHRRAIPLAVVNARVSDRSFPRYLRLRRLWQPLLREVTVFLAQSQETADRLLAMGVTAERVKLTGNLKYDVQVSQESAVTQRIRSLLSIPDAHNVRSRASTDESTSGNDATQKSLAQGFESPLIDTIRALQNSSGYSANGATHISLGRRPRSADEQTSRAESPTHNRPPLPKLIVAGSTLATEEDRLLVQWPAIQKAHPDTILLVAPRHKNRFPEVLSAIQQTTDRLIQCSRLSLNTEPIVGGAILLLDTIGDLASLYSLADIAFVGGSLVPRGGHNPLEPAQFGVPVVIGPSYENFRDVVDRMRAADAIRIVADPQDLQTTLIQLLSNPDQSKQLGARGQRVFEAQQGATARTVAHLLDLLP